MADRATTISFRKYDCPNGWDKLKIGNIGKIQMCKRVFNHETTETGDIPFYKIGTFGKEANAFISRQHFEDYKERFSYPKIGDILISAAGTIGRSAIFKGEQSYYQDSNIVWLENNEKIVLNSYLYYLYQVVKYQTEGGTIQRLYNNIIYGTWILTPVLPEQRAIAKVLGKMDEAISANKQLIAQKALRKKWLMQNLLTGKKRLKGFGGEWKEYSLGEMFAERNERNTDELPLLSIGQNGVYPQDESIKKDTSNADKSKYKKICVGDIGYNTMRMWQGRSALSNLEGIVSPAYTILKPKKAADALFFSYLFKTPKMVNLFWRNSQGLVGDTLNCKYKDLSIIRARLPLKEEQIVVAQILQAADKELSLLKAKTDKLKEQKKGMMQVLLTGKKRLNLDLFD
jgi:type I restriction enzyme S subunit